MKTLSPLFLLLSMFIASLPCAQGTPDRELRVAERLLGTGRDGFVILRVEWEEEKFRRMTADPTAGVSFEGYSLIWGGFVKERFGVDRNSATEELLGIELEVRSSSTFGERVFFE